MLNDKSILVTGGTGSFGKRLVRTILARYKPRRLIVFSRDELKQFEMQQIFPDSRFDCMRYFLGDVRDKDRLYRAFDGVDVVIHAAALKQVPAAEYNPIEAIRTNVLGAANVIDAAIDKGVRNVVALSTDKAANPINLYGATKLCSDKLFTAARSYSNDRTRFCVVRYGNVIGSRGSVVPVFLRQKQSGEVTITDERMTRFVITLDQGVQFVLDSLARMQGGEIFVPKIPSVRINDIAESIAKGCVRKYVGIRPGEKLHEVMVAEDDARNTLEFPNHFAILPDATAMESPLFTQNGLAHRCAEDFRYSSDRNDVWVDADGFSHLWHSEQASEAQVV